MCYHPNEITHSETFPANGFVKAEKHCSAKDYPRVTLDDIFLLERFL